MEELLRPQRGKSESISFPLPKNALPTVELKPAEKQHYRLAVSNIIDATVQMESEFQFNDAGQVDTDAWKLAAEDGGIKVYKRARCSHQDSDENTQPTVVGAGSMPGTIEDAIYGFYCSTTDEFRAVSLIVNPDYLDAAVVAVVEESTQADPFRYLSLNWRLSTTPAGWLIANRDSFSIDGSGISEDYNGNRFGYFVMKSIERPDFPPFSPSIVIRSWLSLCYIFRQAGPNTVSVYIKGSMDLGGKFPDWFTYNYICPRLPVISASIKTQTAKRITSLAIRQSQSLSATLGFYQLRSTSSLSSGSEQETSTSGQRDSSEQIRCVVCNRKGGLLGPSLKNCRVCGCAACSKCIVKTELLALPSNIKIVCCKSCVLKAKAQPIDPNMLCPIFRSRRNLSILNKS